MTTPEPIKPSEEDKAMFRRCVLMEGLLYTDHSAWHNEYDLAFRHKDRAALKSAAEVSALALERRIVELRKIRDSTDDLFGGPIKLGPQEANPEKYAEGQIAKELEANDE